MPNFQFAILVSTLYLNTLFIVDDSSAWFPLVLALIWLGTALFGARKDN